MLVRRAGLTTIRAMVICCVLSFGAPAFMGSVASGAVENTNSGSWVNVTPPSVNLNDMLGCGNYGTETVQVDPMHPSNLYTEFNCQGLWRSTDYGATWTGPINRGTNGAKVSDCAGGITIPPNSSASVPTIYESCIRGSGTGFWKSVDGGVNWTRYFVAPSGSGRQDYYPPVVDPYNANHLLMAGHEMDYVVESVDGGQHWTNVSVAKGMLEHGGTGAIFFINTGNASTTRGTWLWIAQQSGGIYGTWRTTDSGASWVQVDKNEHPHGASQIYQPDNSGVVYMAGAYSNLGWGILRSTDYGETWTHVGMTNNQTVAFGTSENVYAMFGYPIGIGGVNDPAFEVAHQPGTGKWSTPGTPAGLTQGAAQIGVVNDGTHNVFVGAMWNSGVWRYIEGASAGIATAGTLSISSNGYRADQNVDIKAVTVDRLGGARGSASVICRTLSNTAVAGVEFMAVAKTLKWTNGDASPKTCDVPILNTMPFFGTKSFFVEIATPTGATLGPITKSTVSVLGDQQISKVALSAAAYSVKQNAGALSVTVVRTGYDGGKASIGYATANGSAMAGKDYTATRGELTWNNGDTAPKTFVVPINNAVPFRGNKTLAIAIAGATGTLIGTNSAIASITGDIVVLPPPAPPPVGVTPPTSVSPPTAGLPSGPGFKFTSAPVLTGVTMFQNRDSVIIEVPAVANARDFRVLVQPNSVSANANGTESVSGGMQFCAGVRQHQARTRFVADKVSLFPYYFYTNAGNDSPTNESPPNFYGPPPSPWSWFNLDTPPNLAIEVAGVKANMTVTVEAVDRLCPFPGAIGRQHADIALSQGPDVEHPDNPWINATSIEKFPIVTEAEVVAKYGSLIINGQGWAGGPNVQANPPADPPFAQPAPANPPIVLARAAVVISPLAAPPTPPAAFFDDFSNPNDMFKTLPQPKWTYPRYPSGGELVMQNSKWTIYGNGFTCCTPTATMDGRGYADAYIDNGALHTTLGDWAQDVFSEMTMIPRKTAHLNATNYLHVTYEVPSFATDRRYWVVTLCGSPVPGETLDSTGTLKEQIVHSTFFYLNTGMSPSTAGWNCLQVFNRQGNSYAFSNWESMHNIKGGRPPVPPNKGLYDLSDYIYNSIPSISDPSKTAAYTVHPESDVVVLVNKPIPKANLPEVGGVNEQVAHSAATSPVNVSPLQLDNPAGEIAWFYKVDSQGNPIAPILDDQQLVSPRTKYDLYIRNNRLIMYVNGQPTLCNDFTTPTTTLNIADAAIGFHQVLYHSSGEFVERFVDPDRGAAYHYRYNSPWLDQRTWDNMGFEENAPAPTDFDPRTCFEHTSLGPENNEP